MKFQIGATVSCAAVVAINRLAQCRESRYLCAAFKFPASLGRLRFNERAFS